DRHAARWSRAQVRCVVEIVHRRWQRGDVGDIVRAGIIAVEQIEEFDNWRDLPALPCFERAADTQINLDVRSSVELVHGCLDTVDHRAVIGWIAKPVDVHRRGECERAGGLGLNDRGHLKTPGHVHDAREREAVEDVYSRWTIISRTKR